MRITAFLDFEGSELNSQIEVAKRLNIKNLLIRKINEKKLTELDEEEIKIVNQTIKKEKLNILAIDPLISEYELYDLEAYYINLEQNKLAIDIAKQLKVKYMYFRLPVINDIINEFPNIEKKITPIIDYAIKNNVYLLMHTNNIKSNVMVYLMKHYKTKYLSPIFNPKEYVLNRESPTVAYRLLKNDINFFMAADIDKKNNPELLGYGRLKIIDLFKRLNRDKYSGYIILDDTFSNFIIGEEEISRPWYKRIFKRKATVINEYLQRYASKIFPNEPNHKVTLNDIYLNQIDVLAIVFNLRR